MRRSSPSEATSRSTSQDFPLHFKGHEISGPYLEPPRFPNIHFNIILSFTSRPSQLSLPFRISNQNFVRVLTALKIFGEGYKL